MVMKVKIQYRMLGIILRSISDACPNKAPHVLAFSPAFDTRPASTAAVTACSAELTELVALSNKDDMLVVV